MAYTTQDFAHYPGVDARENKPVLKLTNILIAVSGDVTTISEIANKRGVQEARIQDALVTGTITLPYEEIVLVTERGLFIVEHDPISDVINRFGTVPELMPVAAQPV